MGFIRTAIDLAEHNCELSRARVAHWQAQREEEEQQPGLEGVL